MPKEKQQFTRTKLAYSLTTAAEASSLSPSFLRLEISRGNLKAGHIGRRVVITGPELRRYIESSLPVTANG
jgi:hypothetical protein